MLENMVILINLFVAPVISLYFFGKRNTLNFNFNLEMLCIYSTFVVINSIIGKGVCLILRSLFSVTVEVFSSYYTVIALIFAFVTPLLFEILKKYITITVEEKNEK